MNEPIACQIEVLSNRVNKMFQEALTRPDLAARLLADEPTDVNDASILGMVDPHKALLSAIAQRVCGNRWEWKVMDLLRGPPVFVLIRPKPRRWSDPPGASLLRRNLERTDQAGGVPSSGQCLQSIKF